MASDLRAAVADAIEPITGGNITTEEAADAAIAAVLDHLIERSEQDGVQWSVTSWLRSFREAGQ